MHGVRIYNPERAVALAFKAGMSLEEFNKLYDKMDKMLSVVDTDEKDKKDRVIKLMIDHILDDILYKKKEDDNNEA